MSSTNLVPATKQNKVAKRQPPSLVNRDELLKAAGITRADLAKDIKRARNKLITLTEAKETKFFSEKGKVKDTREVAALEIQRKAAKDLLEFSGSLPSKGQGGSSGPQQVVLIVEKPWVTTESGVGRIVDAKVEPE